MSQTSDYTRDLVDIKGKKYQPVASRLRMALDAPTDLIERLKKALMCSCTTELLYQDEKHIAVRVSVTLKPEYGGGVFQGVAESDRNAKNVEGDSPLEVAETSALGRALAKAGILLDLAELASSNEMHKAQQARSQQQYQQRPAQQPQQQAPRPIKYLPACAACGVILTDVKDRDGKLHSAEEIAAKRVVKFGRVLCTPCAREALITVPLDVVEEDRLPEEAAVHPQDVANDYNGDVTTLPMSKEDMIAGVRELTGLGPSQVLAKIGHPAVKNDVFAAMREAVNETFDDKPRSDDQICRLFYEIVIARRDFIAAKKQ